MESSQRFHNPPPKCYFFSLSGNSFAAFLLTKCLTCKQHPSTCVCLSLSQHLDLLAENWQGSTSEISLFTSWCKNALATWEKKEKLNKRYTFSTRNTAKKGKRSPGTLTSEWSWGMGFVLWKRMFLGMFECGICTGLCWLDFLLFLLELNDIEWFRSTFICCVHESPWTRVFYGCVGLQV